MAHRGKLRETFIKRPSLARSKGAIVVPDGMTIKEFENLPPAKQAVAASKEAGKHRQTRRDPFKPLATRKRK